MTRQQRAKDGAQQAAELACWLIGMGTGMLLAVGIAGKIDEQNAAGDASSAPSRPRPQ